ncbi:MAG: hypothetical protein ACU84H_04105 [Gammaproteobacteria bacterium]
MKFLSAVKKEIKEIGIVTLYFFFCFGVILTLKQLFLETYHIQVHVLSTAAISALIAAKIVIILDKTAAGTRFDASYPLGLAALYKTLVYMLATFVVLFLEKLFHAYRETGAFVQAVAEIWEESDRNIMFAKVICIGLMFFGYHLFAGLDRRLGEGTLRRLVTVRPTVSETNNTGGK